MGIKYNYEWKEGDTVVVFGEKLKTLRKGQKLTQQQLASVLGVQKSVISYYESGDRFPSYDILIKIARTFHTTTDYLLGVSRERTADLSGLSNEQSALVTAIIEEFKKQKH